MRAVFASTPGGPEVLEIREVATPVAEPGEVVIEVAASAVNRADLMQRQGHYPPPPGASDVLGLECSGVVVERGAGADRFQVGDAVCALLTSGGYADRVAAPEGQVLPAPAGVDLVDAAALPEVAATVWSNVFMIASLEAGDLLLVHGGAGGIGTMAIQLAHARGARVVTTVGTADKARFCAGLGADVTVNYRVEDFVEVVAGLGGADVILDNMGASYLSRNIDALATRGRLVVIGLQGGARAEIDLARLMSLRASVAATTLRARPASEKAQIMADVEANVWPLVAAGAVRPVVETRIALTEVSRAHSLVEAGTHTGKVLLTT